MGGTTAEAQVAKKPYKNQTAGHLGVTKLDHLGGQVGFGVEPYGTVYLSDDEAILTARAPKDAKDNPFEEKNYLFHDEEGKLVEAPLRALVLITDQEGNPGEERYVPGLTEDPAPSAVDLSAAAARRADAEAVLDREDERTVPTEPVEATLAPSSVAAVPPSHATRPGAPPSHQPQAPEDDIEPRASWVDNPERTAEPQPGALGGSNEPAPGAAEGTQEAVLEPTPGAVAPQAPVHAPVASSSVEAAGEETAAHLDSGEETGAAEQPTGQAPEGEFAAHEEVGSPEAPTQEAS